jgi:hypothetical protein
MLVVRQLHWKSDCMRKILIILILILISVPVLGGTIIEPVNGSFQGDGNGFVISDIIALEEGRTTGEYYSQVIDAGTIVQWKGVEINFLEYKNTSDVSLAVVIARSDYALENHAMRVEFKSRGRTLNELYMNGTIELLHIEDNGEPVDYWIDESSPYLDVWMKLNFTEGEEKEILVLYGDIIGYEPDCDNVFILCDLLIHSKLFEGSAENQINDYNALGIWYWWENYGNSYFERRDSIISYKYARITDSLDDTTVYARSKNQLGNAIVIDSFTFNDVDITGGDWSDKSLYQTRTISTEDLDDFLNLTFYNENSNSFSVMVTDVLIRPSNFSGEDGYEAYNGIALEEDGVTLEVMTCETEDCIGGKYVPVDENLGELNLSRYLKYKLNFEKQDFVASVSKITFDYNESSLPDVAADAINSSEVRINEIKSLGVNVTDAEIILDNARELLASDEYMDAVSVAKSATAKAEKLYEDYLAGQDSEKIIDDKKEDYEKNQTKARAQELLDLADIAIGNADHSHPDTQRAVIMFTQAELAFNAKDYDLAIQRATRAMDILSGKTVEETEINLIGILAIIFGLILVVSIVYSFVKAKVDSVESE